MFIYLKIVNICSLIFSWQVQLGYAQPMLFNKTIELLLFIFEDVIVCFDLLQRITIKEIKSHPWFLKNLPRELTEMAQAVYYKKENPTYSLQSIEDIMSIVEEAKSPPQVSRSIGGFGWGGVEDDEEETKEAEAEVEEDEYEKRVKEVQESGEFNFN